MKSKLMSKKTIKNVQSVIMRLFFKDIDQWICLTMSFKWGQTDFTNSTYVLILTQVLSFNDAFFLIKFCRWCLAEHEV